MTIKMPRGAFPTPRNVLAASEPYPPEAETAAPTGALPTPNHDLAAARPYRATSVAPDSFLAWPTGIEAAASEDPDDAGAWAEEAFAKACAEPRVLIPADSVRAAARACGAGGLSQFMRTDGFRVDAQAYLDGPFQAVDWMDAATLHDAIAHVGPVKIGVAAVELAASTGSRINGWAVHGLAPGHPQTHWASLCGYGPLPALVDLFGRRQVAVALPADMPQGLGYAMFIGGSIGVIDHGSLMNIIGEAWIRNPTTIVEPVV